MTLQRRNKQMVDLLSADLQARYEPNFAWCNAVSAFSLIPGLRGLWLMSSHDQTGNVYDHSGQGRTLTTVTALSDYSDLRPEKVFDGTNDYLYRLDEAGLRITGTNATQTANKRGLTMGGWFRHDTINPVGNKGILGKWLTAGNQQSYLLFLPNGLATPRFNVSVDGSATTSVTSATAITAGATAWYFIVGRFNPSTEMKIWVNDNITTNLVAIPASIFVSDADLNVYAFNNGAAASRNDGAASITFLSSMYVSDAIIDQLFEQTCAMFSVDV